MAQRTTIPRISGGIDEYPRIKVRITWYRTFTRGGLTRLWNSLFKHHEAEER